MFLSYQYTFLKKETIWPFFRLGKSKSRRPKTFTRKPRRRLPPRSTVFTSPISVVGVEWWTKALMTAATVGVGVGCKAATHWLSRQLPAVTGCCQPRRRQSGVWQPPPSDAHHSIPPTEVSSISFSTYPTLPSVMNTVSMFFGILTH